MIFEVREKETTVMIHYKLIFIEGPIAIQFPWNFPLHKNSRSIIWGAHWDILSTEGEGLISGSFVPRSRLERSEPGESPIKWKIYELQLYFKHMF